MDKTDKLNCAPQNTELPAARPNEKILCFPADLISPDS